ncbi:cell envelope integrity protein TolA [Nitrosococcus oceani]|uniref:cell envelope integrity protein TolA n=1 Tax=Nitrosococcus oceani TaxID=1229 RepID=UPI0004E8A9E6|nr:cell envelope integrity protein TolA [Nitrosococcus oceani]KFI24006.1 energy transducer TonB [Nitrosococcus oceani]
MENPRQKWFAFALALLVHGILFAVLVISLGWTPKPEPVNIAPAQIVQATVVDKEKLLAEAAQRRQAEQDALARQQALAQKREAAERQRAEAQRQQQARAEQARRETQEQQALERKQQEEQARLKRLEAERQAKEEAARRQAEAEKKRAEEEKRQAEAEKRRLEEERRRAEAAKRKAEEERKKIEAAKRKAEEERKKAEAARRQQELQERIEAEKNAAQVEAAIARFTDQMKIRVQRYWTLPLGSQDNLEVLLQVEMLPSGEVRNVKIFKSSGDEAFDRSAKAAVYKAAPLPVPSEPAAAKNFLPSFNFKFCSNPSNCK